MNRRDALRVPGPTGGAGRRRFLRQTLFGAGALFVAPLLPSRRILAQVPAETARKLRFFSEHEYIVFFAAAARLTGHVPGEPGSGGMVDAGLRADMFLSREDPEIQDQIHLLLTIFNSPIAAFIFSFMFSGFVNMDPADQDRYIGGWMTSSLGFRRTGFQALKRLSMSMHYTDEHSWEEIGYRGLEVPGVAR